MVLNDVVTIVFTLISIDGSMQTKEVSIEELKLLEFETLGINSLNLTYLNIYPNPIEERATIEFKSDKKYIGEVIIYNQFGQKVMGVPVSIINGNNFISIECNNLNPGLYFFTIQSDHIRHNPIKLMVK